MFGKITRRDVSHHFNKAKNFLGIKLRIFWGTLITILETF